MKKLKLILYDNLYNLIVMSDNTIKLLTMWYHKSKLFYNCHRDSADYYGKLNQMLGFPAILINVFNTTSLFSNYHQIDPIFILFIAILSLFSAMLTACQNYFEFDKNKVHHAKLMIEYSKILYSIEKNIILIKSDDSYVISQDTMNSILNSFEKLREEYILFPEKIWKLNNIKFKMKLNTIDVETSDSINIILSTIKKNKHFIAEDSSKEYNKNDEVITYSNMETKNISDNSVDDKKDETKINVELSSNT